MLALITIELLKDKLQELKCKGENSELLLYQLEKEITLLESLNVRKLDMIGTPEDFEDKITNYELIFLPKGEWDKISIERDVIQQIRNIYSKCVK